MSALGCGHSSKLWLPEVNKGWQPLQYSSLSKVNCRIQGLQMRVLCPVPMWRFCPGEPTANICRGPRAYRLGPGLEKCALWTSRPQRDLTEEELGLWVVPSSLRSAAPASRAPRAASATQWERVPSGGPCPWQPWAWSHGAQAAQGGADLWKGKHVAFGALPGQPPAQERSI